jgi:hypothetical protein
MIMHCPHSFGPVAMPLFHLQTVPYFSGHVDDLLNNFLDKYEELANACQLSELEKCKTVIHYVTWSHHNLWKLLDEFHLFDRTGFCQALSHIYKSPSTEGKYSQQKLSNFIMLASKTCKKEEDVQQYYRKFLILSKPLLNSQQLTKQE